MGSFFPGVREVKTKVYGRYHGLRRCDVNITSAMVSLMYPIGRETMFKFRGGFVTDRFLS